ncbi:hypothetical protein [Gordonia rhizosphera]|uniref:Uncharacterized protein n=1 Tax=Gordonia rhizosphera NBRC 16068 TaxID=1108045 RepID=K6VBY2_9ACTN|nr:hypothetical protein [Gordonia rhizosphera]GAB93723.1 hypothetical protein GORHZ_242_00070 [Gordonia rhizosphera NBRC 16068]
MSDIEAAIEQLRAIMQGGNEKAHRRHRVVCGVCGADVLIVWDTDPLVYRVSRIEGYNYYPARDDDTAQLAEDDPLATEWVRVQRNTTINKRSKRWSRPYLCSELLDFALAIDNPPPISLPCRCARPVQVRVLQLVIDIETHRAKRTIERP